MDQDNFSLILSNSMNDVKVIHFDANNVDKRQQKNLLQKHQLNCQIDCGSPDIQQAINTSH